MPPRCEHTFISGLQPLTEALAQLIPNANLGRTQAKIVVSHGAYFLDGLGVREEIESWLEHMDDVLKVMRCLMDQRVRLSSWSTVPRIGGRRSILIFRLMRFGPGTSLGSGSRIVFLALNFKQSEYGEFFSLEQGDMAVIDYKREFQRLVEYCPGIRDNADEKKKQLPF